MPDSTLCADIVQITKTEDYYSESNRRDKFMYVGRLDSTLFIPEKGIREAQNQEQLFSPVGKKRGLHREGDI